MTVKELHDQLGELLRTSYQSADVEVEILSTSDDPGLNVRPHNVVLRRGPVNRIIKSSTQLVILRHVPTAVVKAASAHTQQAQKALERAQEDESILGHDDAAPGTP